MRSTNIVRSKGRCQLENSSPQLSHHCYSKYLGFHGFITGEEPPPAHGQEAEYQKRHFLLLRRSDAETVAFQPEESESVLRVATYHNDDFVRTVIWSPPSEHDPVRKSLVEAFPSTTVSDPSCALESLPTEILSQICLELDIRLCFKIRQTSRHARQVVAGSYQYRAIATHGLESLRSLTPDRRRVLLDYNGRLPPAFHPSLYRVRRPVWRFLFFVPTAKRSSYNCIR